MATDKSKVPKSHMCYFKSNVEKIQTLESDTHCSITLGSLTFLRLVYFLSVKVYIIISFCRVYAQIKVKKI